MVGAMLDLRRIYDYFVRIFGADAVDRWIDSRWWGDFANFGDSSAFNEQITFTDILGSDADEDLIGSGRAERLYGFGGNDRLYAKGGNDELFGGDGNDLLDGGDGRDLMVGGAGDDSYIVGDPGDVVSEESAAGVDDGGVDTVKSEISFSLGNYVEKLQLTGAASTDGTGNDLNNNIKGNGGNNTLFGGDGRDTMYGYGGNDTLVGGLDRDYLFGGDDADTFVLRPEPGNWDKIYDMAAEDWIGIYASEFGLSEGAGFTGGVLDSAYFVAGASATAVGHGQFVFRFDKSELLWDADGAGAGSALRITLVQSAAVITASQIIAFGENASVSVSSYSTDPQAEDSGSIYFELKLSQPLNDDVLVSYSTADGSASAADEDFVSVSSGELLLRAGSTTAYIPIELLNDDLQEGTETFSLVLNSATVVATGESVALGTNEAFASIVDEGPTVVADTATSQYGITDPSGIAYDASRDKMYISDSEVDEEPFFSSQTLFRLDTDGSLDWGRSLRFTSEATGLAIDSDARRLFVTDDDQYKVFAVSLGRIKKVQWEFDTTAVGAYDPEDIAFDSVTGNLFIVNGIDRTIVETDQFGTQQIDSFVLAPEILDPEALAYDSDEEVFYVGGGFSDKIWKLDRDGDVIDVITVLEGARSSDLNRRVNVKDIELAPASDGSGEKHLYVADFGWSHEADGRMIEIDPGDVGSYWADVA